MSQERFVIGPYGTPITRENLPPADTHWVPRRKAEVVALVDGGLVSFHEVKARYRISDEEFKSWKKSIREFGMRGLRTTRLQQYRRTA